ncbi:hypothetical protein RvY_12413 [Ramazzottius varieornatus]|uniref:Cytochrome b5 heme-binding domain-containing protein n=1 Tax=Ramazzottius varieornatus TaxID=947166 RepID=A0A1D1VS22_RAMVA|nr:hypothetical protein RvY_12413 [Ramazzottius varieornatus]
MTTETIVQQRTASTTRTLKENAPKAAVEKEKPEEVKKAVAALKADRDVVRGFPVTTPLIAGLKCFTWEEVGQHNSQESCWCYINNKVYDITTWLDRHPGGKKVLLLAAGRDCTDLFISYHPFTEKPAQLLAKYCIGQVTTTEFPQYQPDSGFYKEVRQKVAEYFKENKLVSKDAKPGLVRLGFILLVAALAYSLLVYDGGSLSWSIKLLAAIVFGVAQSLCLMHAMHDASHSAIGPNETWWNFVGKFCLDWFAGASINSWHNQHILGHHIYTNVMGVDPDLPVEKEGDIRRVCWQQKWAPAYRFQHVYLCVLYGFLALKFRIQDITSTIIDHSNGNIRVNDLGWKETTGQILSKLVWLSWRFILPVTVFHVAPLPFLCLFLLIEFVTGYFLTFNFQVSHISPLAEFPDGQGASFVNEWAQSQLKTTVDYAYHSWLTTFLTGALNYQSVHHLFPSVSQYHYPAIAPIVKQVAEKWQVPINYLDTFSEAVAMHLKHLQAMGVHEVLHHH